jgi:hypothetical protein
MTRITLTLIAAAMLSAGCDAEDPIEPVGAPAFSTLTDEQKAALVRLRAVTARYHDIDFAIRDGFVLLHGCESRPGGAAGAVYIQVDRYVDGVIDPELPDGLLYAPRLFGKPKLVGVELAIPRPMSPQGPPSFLGVPFQEEEEFDAYGLHVWAWLPNPDGVFAEAHPHIRCLSE